MKAPKSLKEAVEPGDLTLAASHHNALPDLSPSHSTSTLPQGSNEYLNTLYPTHASSLATLNDAGYKNAYRSFLRSRIHAWVMEDIPSSAPVTSSDVADWAGVKLKTMQNDMSRVNQTVIARDFLRSLPHANQTLEDIRDMQTLTVLVDGPLIPIPLKSAERDGDLDPNIVDRVLRLSVRKLDLIRDRIRALMP